MKQTWKLHKARVHIALRFPEEMVKEIDQIRGTKYSRSEIIRLAVITFLGQIKNGKISLD